MNVEKLFENVEWQKCEGNEQPEGGMAYSTHEGVLDIGGIKLKCARLNTGHTVIDADDLEAFFLQGGELP